MSFATTFYQPQVDEIPEPIYQRQISQTRPVADPDKVMDFVQRFVGNLKKLSPSYRFKMYSKKIHQIVSDKSADFNYYLNNRHLNQQPTKKQQLKHGIQTSTNNILLIAFKIYTQLRHKVIVLNPGGSFLFYWESLVLLLSILNIMYIPMEMCFAIYKGDFFATKLLLGILPSYVFLFDMILSFFKGYYEKGVLHTSKTEMFWHYFKGDLFFDMCVVFPFFLEAFGFRNTNYFMLLRITRIKRTFDTIEETFNFQQKSAAIFELLCLICFVVMTSHFCACMFHYIAIIEKQYGYEHTWQDDQHISDADWITKYVYAIYFTAITSMTVGYGDIVPVTNPEKIFVTLVTFVVTGMFGYVITTIGSIVQKLQDQENSFQQKIRLINAFIHKRGLSNELQFKVRTYFEHYLQVKQEEQINLEELMNQMNRNLREEVQVQLYQNYLLKSNFIRKNFSLEFIKTLCHKLKEQNYSPEENLYSKGKMPNRLIIIISGSVQSYVPGQSDNEDITLREYNEGYVIGEREFFLKEGVQFCVKAKSFVQTAYLTDEDFTQILQTYPSDLERYCYLRDKYIFGDGEDHGIMCEVCSSSHAFNECPFSFVYLNRGRCITSVTRTENHVRTKHPSKRKSEKVRHQHFEVRHAAVRHILKESVQTKQYNEEFFSKQYLTNIGFNVQQIRHLKQTILSSQIRHYIKHQNDRRISVLQNPQDMSTPSPRHAIITIPEEHDEENQIIMKIEHNFPLSQEKPTELLTSFDIDRLDRSNSKVYYPHDNIDRVIDKLRLSGIMAKLAGYLMNNKKRREAIAQRLMSTRQHSRS